MSRLLGYTPSALDGTEYQFKANIKLPESYTYLGTISGIEDQGQKPWCLPYSLTAVLNTEMNMRNNTHSLDYGFNEREIYSWREDKKLNGMMPKTALSHIRHNGIEYETGNKIYIDQYAMVRGAELIKMAILINGPVLIGLPVRDSSRTDFWNGYKDEGGHAVALVGYDKDGFVLRNSWGTSYGVSGYTTFPFEDTGKILEAWTLTYKY